MLFLRVSIFARHGRGAGSVIGLRWSCEIVAVPTTTSVTPCSPPSRTLRAAFRRWPKRAMLDRVCARRHWAKAGRDGKTALGSNRKTDQKSKQEWTGLSQIADGEF